MAAHQLDADLVKEYYPQFRSYVVMTPSELPSGLPVGDYVWTPEASDLPASVRLRLRGVLAPFINPRSTEQEFPPTLWS